MKVNGAYGYGNDQLSSPLISPDWNGCPAIVERENMSASSLGVGSPSARNVVTPFIDVTRSFTNFVVRWSGWLDSTGNRSPVGLGLPNCGIRDSKSGPHSMRAPGRG